MEAWASTAPAMDRDPNLLLDSAGRILAAFIAVLFVLMVVNRVSVAFQLWWKAKHGDRPEPRGFEVKPITGDQARTDTKKDDHHG